VDGLAVETGHWLSPPRLSVGTVPIAPINRWGPPRFLIHDASGNYVTIRLRTRAVDPIPKVEVDGETVEIAQPFSGYEKTLLLAPFAALVVAWFLWAFYRRYEFGSSLAILLLGHLGAQYLAKKFRADKTKLPRWVLSGLVSAAGTGWLLAILWAVSRGV
jgi:hypothetical protein